MPTRGEWEEWRKRCALGLCVETTRHALRQFAAARFASYVDAYAHRVNFTRPAALLPGPDAPWHLFETHLCTRRNRAGKSYKEWLFARGAAGAADEFDTLQGGASLLMRDVVREFLRRECPARGVDSLDQPVAGAAGRAPVTLRELLPGTDDVPGEVEAREIRSLAAPAADVMLAGWNRRRRVALLARELGLSLAHPVVVAAVPCRKSALNKAYHEALRAVAAWPRARHPGEDCDWQAAMSRQILEELKKRILLWGRAENACAPFFLIMEHEDPV